MTDIWRSFVAQAGLWKQGKKIAFRSATVVQERNEHNLMRDFNDEVVGYLRNEEIVSTLEKIEAMPLENFVLEAWKELEQTGVAINEEVRLANAWMEEVKKYL